MTNAFLACYSSAGEFEWVRTIGGDDYDFGVDLALAENGEVALVGSFRRSARIESRAGGPQRLSASTACAEIFLAVFDAEGTPRWATSAGGPSRDVPTRVRSDRKGGWIVEGRIATLRSDSHATFGAGEATEVTLRASGGSEFTAHYDGRGRFRVARQHAARVALALER